MYYCCFPKTRFSDNSEKYKTKTIPKNSIFIKPKYGFKNKYAALLNRFRFVYCCFVQFIRLESGPLKNLFKFPDLTFSFQFSYGFFIFCCIIFDLLPQLLCSLKLQLLFHVKVCLLVGREKVSCISISRDTA